MSSILWAKNKLGPSASGITLVVLIPFRFMISEQTDSPDKVSIVNKSPILTSTGGLVIAVPNSPNRSTVRFSPFSLAGKETQIYEYFQSYLKLQNQFLINWMHLMGI